MNILFDISLGGGGGGGGCMGKMSKDEKGGVGVILGQILADVICERSLRPERSQV